MEAEHVYSPPPTTAPSAPSYYHPVVQYTELTQPTWQPNFATRTLEIGCLEAWAWPISECPRPILAARAALSL